MAELVKCDCCGRQTEHSLASDEEPSPELPRKVSLPVYSDVPPDEETEVDIVDYDFCDVCLEALFAWFSNTSVLYKS